MRIVDLLSMSVGNLWKRKIRTVLTVLGVVIGTASIVVMVSLGLGLNRSTMEDIEENGGLTSIHVYESSSYTESGEVADKDKKRLDDELIEKVRSHPGVKLVSGVLSISALAKCGVYESYLSIIGMSGEALQSMDLELEYGSLPLSESELSFLYGNMVPVNFWNAKMDGGGSAPDIDLREDTVFYIYDIDAYYGSQNNQTDQGGARIKPPKKYLAPCAGLIAGGPDTYHSNSWDVYCNIEALEAQLKKIFKDRAIPGQPLTSSGKPFKKLYYNELYVEAEDMDCVGEIQKWLSDLGYEAHSNTEWVESTQRQYGYVQAVLGGIGAVSLIVAAIGITNTMMMSIYERTKEIGVMKVLGCDMRDIRRLFLMEAGFIGLIGGFAGILLSFLISFAVNRIVSGMGVEMTLSYIPGWLAASGIAFAVLVGMLAGLFPALRAMRLSPLEAIRRA